MRIPRYRPRPDRGYAFVEHLGTRKRLPGPINSPQSLAAYHAFCEAVAKSEGKPLEIKLPATGGLTVNDLAAAYLDYCLTYYRKGDRVTSEYHCVRAAVTVVVSLYGSTRATEFGPLLIESTRSAMVAKDWARTTINGHIDRIRRMFDWAVSKELVPVTVAQALKYVKSLGVDRGLAREPVPRKPVEDWVVDATLPHLTPVVRDMVRLQRITGMRSQSLVAIRKAEIDQSNDVWLYKPVRDARKGSDELVIPLGPKSQEILRPYLEGRAADEYCFSPQESQQFRNRPANKRTRAFRPLFSTGSYRRSIWWGIKAANKSIEKETDRVPHWHPHQLRHTVGTNVRKKWKLEGARVYLGHLHSDATEIYAEADVDLACEIAREIG